MTHLLLHVNCHIQPVRKLGLLPQIVRCPAFGRLLFASEQWGFVNDISQNSYVTLPISATPLAVLANDINMDHEPLILATFYYENGKFMIDGRRVTNTNNIWGHWIAICI